MRGNLRWVDGDLRGMNDELRCATARELISTDADDELGRGDHDRLDAHLERCHDCTAYAESIAGLTRRLRVGAVRHDHHLVAAVMQTADRRSIRLGRGGWMRPALAWCALVVAVQSVQPLFLGDVSGASTHVARHVGATSLALAIGFVVVAWRPSRAQGLLPFVAALAVTTVCAAVLDIAGGRAVGSSELVHLSEVVGMLLLWMIAGSPGADRLTGVVMNRGVDRSTM